MELRTYLEVLRRQCWLIMAVTVVVALAAGTTSILRTPLYRAEAQVLLRPNDPSEELQPYSRNVADPARYLSAQLNIIKSKAVAREAAKAIPGSTIDELLAQVSTSQSGATDIVIISATSSDPALATKVANAFARAYIENRRQFSIEGLDRAGKQLDAKLAELQTRIGELETRIADGTGDGQAPPYTALITPRKRPSNAPIPSAPQPADGATSDIGPSTSDSALRAARAATEVQYQTVYARQQELLIEKSLQRGEAELVSEAETPRSPVSPRPMRDTALGGIMGLLLGLVIAFLKEQLDDRLHTREEVEAASGLPVLAELPFDPDSTRDPDAVASQLRPTGGLAEAVRALRTSITFLGVDGPVRRVVVTSGGSAEGKSLVAANLAIAYAQSGMHTILVSADLRRPRLDEMFCVPRRSAGLSDVIAGLSQNRPTSNGHGPSDIGLEEALSAALLPTDVDGLFLLPAGKLPPNPAELLGSQRAGEVLEVLSGRADVVVIDTPPVLAVTDAAVLAPRADGVVVVAAAGQTHKGALTRSTETMAATRARVLGVVFNKVGNKSVSGYRYSYGRYYRASPEETDRQRGTRISRRRAARSTPEADR